VRFAKSAGHLAGALLRTCYYKPGGVYTIPFGVNRGLRLRYRPAMHLHAMAGLVEKDTCRALRDALRPGMSVVDVGANIGFLTMLMARAVGDGGQVVAFEPAPWPREMLVDHLAMNGFANTQVVPLAVSNEVGEIDLYVASDHHQSSLLEDWAHPSGQLHPATIRVPTVTLDAFLEERGMRPDLIKMDIEGAAVLALQGCEGLARRSRPVLLVELHNPAEDRALGDFLARHSYRARRVAPPRGEIRDLATTWPDPDGMWGTVLARPVE